jgi:hypothetical protein
MRKLSITGVTVTVALFGMWVGATHAQRAQAGAAPPAPTDKAMYIPNSEIQSTWKDLEARQVINRRAMEGGAYSINIRIVKTSL